MKRIMALTKALLASKIFLDIDNTLAVFSHGKNDDPRAIAESLNQGFYLNLEPMPHLWVYKILAFFLDVYVVSAYPNTPYSAIEKRLWVNLHMPFIKESNIILVPLGSNKAEIVESIIGKKIDKRCYLVDDYGKNLNDWANRGGTPIKKSANPAKKRSIPTIYKHYHIFNVLYKTAI